MQAPTINPKVKAVIVNIKSSINIKTSLFMGGGISPNL